MATPFEKLLGVQTATIAILNIPKAAANSLGKQPSGVTVTKRLSSKKTDAVLAFVHDQSELLSLMPTLKGKANETDRIWLAYPKGTGTIVTDLHKSGIHRHCISEGLQGMEIISLDTTWSILRMKEV